MDLLSCPHLPVLKILENVDLTASLRSILKPTIPVTIIRKPVLTETGLEDFISGFRPGKFVFEFCHYVESLTERFVNLNWGLLLLMAIARAFLVPISTTNFLALVMPV
jgi:hypothetical protein